MQTFNNKSIFYKRLINFNTGIKIGHQVIIGYDEILSPKVDNVRDSVIIHNDVIIHEGSIIYKGCRIGAGTMIGHHVIMREHTSIGSKCKIGHHVVFEGATEVGKETSIQTQCHITSYSQIGSYVFIGPMTTTTNDPVISYKRPKIEVECMGVSIKDGARIGAGCLILPGVTIGKEALVGAGSLVTKDVPDYTVAYGWPAQNKNIVKPEHLLLLNGKHSL